MANNDGRFSIYEVNSLLYQIISYMSETERRKLQLALMAKAKNGKDLSSLITGLTEVKRCELLGRLTNWYITKYSELRRSPKRTELRGYPRKPINIPVELSKNGFIFMCLTQNISNSGVFIQTDFNFRIDQQITMVLSPPRSKKDITVGGRIKRVDSNGIGVKFDELIPDFAYTFS
jgi:hypothetical protein